MDETVAQMLDQLLEELREHTRLLDELVMSVRAIATDAENTARRVDELADELAPAAPEPNDSWMPFGDPVPDGPNGSLARKLRGQGYTIDEEGYIVGRPA